MSRPPWISRSPAPIAAPPSCPEVCPLAPSNTSCAGLAASHRRRQARCRAMRSRRRPRCAHAHGSRLPACGVGAPPRAASVPLRRNAFAQRRASHPEQTAGLMRWCVALQSVTAAWHRGNLAEPGRGVRPLPDDVQPCVVRQHGQRHILLEVCRRLPLPGAASVLSGMSRPRRNLAIPRTTRWSARPCMHCRRSGVHMLRTLGHCCWPLGASRFLGRSATLGIPFCCTGTGRDITIASRRRLGALLCALSQLDHLPAVGVLTSASAARRLTSSVGRSRSCWSSGARRTRG